jgi:hypothetical protein
VAGQEQVYKNRCAILLLCKEMEGMRRDVGVRPHDAALDSIE